MKEDFESTRQKYKPKKPEAIKFLLIAEAPPKVESSRFFYFEDIWRGNSLSWETMKVVYPDDCLNIKSVRQRKREFLERFKNDGFYLIDATDVPMKDARRDKKKRQLEKALPSLIEKVRSLVSEDTKIVLISSTVYKVCCNRLKVEGFNVINECAIPFPSFRWQPEFREKLSELLRRYGWRASYNTA